MPKKSKQSRKQQKDHDPSIVALRYTGPITANTRQPRIDDYVTVLGYQGSSDWGASAGNSIARILFRANSSGGVPATMAGNWFLSVGDVASFASFATEFGSFRVLGVKVTVVNHLTSSTSGFGSKPCLSTVVRENSTITNLVDTPGVEIHPISTSANMFHREMRMEGVDEAEWVDSANVYTPISPQPTVAVLFPDTANLLEADIYVQYRVQFRGRL